ncbi:MAG: capsule assembly Wzi family protein [Spirochaetales bacterium]|nr:capsule assembly Wzi family protein [Spirochaetales bacterium]
MGGKKQYVLVCLLLLFCLVSLEAYSDQRFIPSDAEVFSRIQQLHRIEGRAIPPRVGPWTERELFHAMERLPRLSEGKLFGSIQAGLAYRPLFPFSGQGSADISPAYSFEAYLHINEEDFTEEPLWHPRWKDRLPILSIPISFTVADHFSTHVEFLVVRRLLDYANGTHYVYAPEFSTNHSLRDFFQLDFNWPYSAIAVAGGNQWNLQIGRERLNLGPGHTGNLLLSDHLPYHDYMMFKAWLGPIKYSTALVGFPSPAETGTGTAKVKALFTHRFDWTILPEWHFAITEAMMYQDGVIDFRFLNPLMIYHQYFMASVSNSFLTAETWVSILPGFALYGQIGFDDVRFIDESDSKPNALGWQVGMEYGWVVPSGSYLLWAEYVHTDPYLYLRDGIDYVVSFKAMEPDGGATRYVREYVGYPLGGDATVYAVGLDWDSLENWNGFIRAEYAVDGAVGFDSPYPPADPQVTTPTGIPETRVRGTVGASFRISAGKFGLERSSLRVNGSVSYVMIHNLGNTTHDPIHDVQGSLGIAYIL